MNYIDTHCHLDGKEFRDDRDAVVQRAREAGCTKILVPAIDYRSSCDAVELVRHYPGYIFPMIGLHPEEVRADWQKEVEAIKQIPHYHCGDASDEPPYEGVRSIVAIGEVGLDFYWSREYEKEQLEAFEEQVRWSVESRLPLMIHCRKAQNEMVSIIKRYARELPGGVFHCFTGNEHEALELLQFDRFCLGIGGVLTFKSSHLPEVLPQVASLDRIVLETDAPYMAPVPMRGKRNEPAFVRHVITRLAQAYNCDEEVVAATTTANAERLFGLPHN